MKSTSRPRRNYWKAPTSVFTTTSLFLPPPEPNVMTKPDLATLIRNFFEQYLISQRGLSGHTVLAYRDTWKLLLQFVSRRHSKTCVGLALEDLKTEKPRYPFMAIRALIMLSLAKFPERIWNHAVPGHTFDESHPQGSGLTRSHTFGARRRLIHFVKNSSGINQKRFSGGAYLHAAWQAVKQFETDLLFQVLNLSGKRGLGDAQAFRGASVMLLLRNMHEVSQVSQFHFDTLWLSVR